jgi:hypothetical protein
MAILVVRLIPNAPRPLDAGNYERSGRCPIVNDVPQDVAVGLRCRGEDIRGLRLSRWRAP